MKGYVICQDTLCGVVIDWITNEDGTESPDFYTDSRQAAREIIDQRIEWARSRLDNLDAMDEDDCDEANGEAGDDLGLYIQPCTITGASPGARIKFDDWETSELLSDFHWNNGRDGTVRWPLDSPLSGE